MPLGEIRQLCEWARPAHRRRDERRARSTSSGWARSSASRRRRPSCRWRCRRREDGGRGDPEPRRSARLGDGRHHPGARLHVRAYIRKPTCGPTRSRAAGWRASASAATTAGPGVPHPPAAAGPAQRPHGAAGRRGRPGRRAELGRDRARAAGRARAAAPDGRAGAARHDDHRRHLQRQPGLDAGRAQPAARHRQQQPPGDRGAGRHVRAGRLRAGGAPGGGGPGGAGGRQADHRGPARTLDCRGGAGDRA